MNDDQDNYGVEWKCPYQEANESSLIPSLIVVTMVFVCFGLIGLVTGVWK